jgi:hypothetical protein
MSRRRCFVDGSSDKLLSDVRLRDAYDLDDGDVVEVAV